MFIWQEVTFKIYISISIQKYIKRDKKIIWCLCGDHKCIDWMQRNVNVHGYKFFTEPVWVLPPHTFDTFYPINFENAFYHTMKLMIYLRIYKRTKIFSTTALIKLMLRTSLLYTISTQIVTMYLQLIQFNLSYHLINTKKFCGILITVTEYSAVQSWKLLQRFSHSLSISNEEKVYLCIPH